MGVPRHAIDFWSKNPENIGPGGGGKFKIKSIGARNNVAASRKVRMPYREYLKQKMLNQDFSELRQYLEISEKTSRDMVGYI